MGYARQNDFTLVTKDADFGDLSILRGVSPKVIWIRRVNCKTSDIEKILRDNFDAIKKLENDSVLGLLTLFQSTSAIIIHHPEAKYFNIE